jgi:site-specific recombinase XerD
VILDRADGKVSATVYHYATLLRTIARHWVKAEERHIKELDNLCKRLTPKSHGMTDKNRARLRQFDDPARILDLLDLPERLLRQAESDNDESSATKVLYAVAIELLIVTAMRIKNLTELEVGRHLVGVRHGSRSLLHVVIPGEEVKNGEALERELPRQAVALLGVYLKSFRPQLTSGQSPMLFPNSEGGKRSPSSFGRGISQVILRETGIKMHPHLFRHAAAKFHLEANPEDIESVRRILGHKSIDTTTRVYADMKTAAAYRRYDSVVEKLRGEIKQRADASAKHRRGGAL